ncbi:MAG TPA: SDR family oxidoreductase [Myxococcaceae bacterium]|nr:SDR family oxidoreductase [Myxococcaceae bacterium]
MAETLLMVGVRKLGRTLALHFARKGWRVVCASRTAAEVEALARDVTAAGGEGVAAVCDLQRPESLVRFGEDPPDLLVAAQTMGGRFGALPLLEIPFAELTQSLAAYPQGTWNLLRAVGPGMLARGRGTFLQIGTSSGIRTKEGFAALGAAQQSLRALVQVAAREWRTRGVHVAYLPIDGPIASEPTRAAGFAAERLISPEAIAEACAFLHGQRPDAWTHELVLRPTGGEWSAPT